MKFLFDEIKKELDILLWIVLILGFNFFYPLAYAVDWFSNFTPSFLNQYDEVFVILFCLLVLVGLLYSGKKYATTQSDEDLARMDEREALHEFEVANIGYRVFVYTLAMYMLIIEFNILLMLLFALVAIARLLKRVSITKQEN